MRLNLSPICKGAGEINFSEEPELSPVELAGGKLIFVKTLFSGKISHDMEQFKITAICKGKVKTTCARCLNEAIFSYDFEIDEVLEPDGGYLLAGNVFPMDIFATDAIVPNIPQRVLCSDDCKGLCNICGCDKNQQDCGHE